MSETNCRIATRWEPDKTPNWRRYYVRLEVTDDVIAIISTIRGVAGAHVKERYSFWVHRSPAFEWAEIHPLITDLLRFCLVEVNIHEQHT